jgi:hypothetical protein
MILYFIHVPRTGGNSVASWLNNNNDKFITKYDGHDRYSKQNHDSLKKSDKTIAFTSLRDPVDLTVSFYAYIKIAALHRSYKEANSFSFSDWIVKSKEHKNFFTRFFNNLEWDKLINPPIEYINPSEIQARELVENAYQTLNNFDYILDTSSLTNDINNMCAKESINCKFNVHINSYPKPEISKSDIEKIKEVCSLDYELLKKIQNIKIKY